MRHEFWTIAYRPRGEQTLLESADAPFRVIPNTWRYWCADPHLFELDGQTYVFAELYDRVLRRGVIGCCQITDRGPSKWKVVLKTPFHLSYPHIFAENDGIYMIPESYVGGEIALYRAVKFPTQWERIRPIRQNCAAVDTTRIPWAGQMWLLTQTQTDDNTGCLMYLLTEIALSRDDYSSDTHFLLDKLRKYKSIFRTLSFDNTQEEIRFFFLSNLPFGVYKHLIRLKRH